MLTLQQATCVPRSALLTRPVPTAETPMKLSRGSCARPRRWTSRGPCQARVRLVVYTRLLSGSLLSHSRAWKGEAAISTENCGGRRHSWSMLIGVLVLCLLAGCWGSNSTPTEVVRPVNTIVVSAGEDTRVRSFPGKAEASRGAELAGGGVYRREAHDGFL